MPVERGGTLQLLLRAPEILDKEFFASARQLKALKASKEIDCCWYFCLGADCLFLPAFEKNCHYAAKKTCDVIVFLSQLKEFKASRIKSLVVCDIIFDPSMP